MYLTYFHILSIFIIIGLLIAILVKQYEGINSTNRVNENVNNMQEKYDKDFDMKINQDKQQTEQFNQQIEKQEQSEQQSLPQKIIQVLENIQEHQSEISNNVKLIPYKNLHFKQIGKGIQKNNQMKHIDISVIIPIYNGEEYFQKAINSVVKQTYKPKEILIGVNGHKKDSEVFKHIKQIVESLKKSLNTSDIDIQLYNYEKPSKIQTCNNLVEKATGHFIALLDVDDYWIEDKLFYQVELLHKFNIDVIGTKCKYFNDGDDSINTVPNIEVGFVKIEQLLTSNQIINSSVLIRKDLAFWNILFENGLEDYELWFRLMVQGHVIYNVDKELVMHRIHKDSFYNTKNQDEMSKLIKQTFDI